eukprot:7539281-Heterocapsa_arctica.AAC.1
MLTSSPASAATAMYLPNGHSHLASLRGQGSRHLDMALLLTSSRASAATTMYFSSGKPASPASAANAIYLSNGNSHW